MHSLTSPAPAVKASRKPARRTARLSEALPGRLVLTITEWFVRTARATSYHFRAVGVDFGQAGFELVKFSGAKEPGTYHVHLDAQLGNTCDCKGFVRWGHCKHADCLAELFRRGLVKPVAR
jgi:hypothetical protein